MPLLTPSTVPLSLTSATNSHTILGPRTEPARDLRKTVAQLRRMNSAAKSNSRSGRRYLQLGREASRIPVLSAKGNESNFSLPGLSPGSENNSTPIANSATPNTNNGDPHDATAAPPQTSTTATTLDFDLGIGLGLDLGFHSNPRTYDHSHNYSNSIYPRTSYDDDANSSRISLATMDTGRFGAGGASSSYWGTGAGGMQGAVSLSDLILAESENMNIFAREELAAANPGTGGTSGSPTRSFWGESGGDSGKTGQGKRSSVWEDGEGFWGRGEGGVAAAREEEKPRQLFSMDGDSDVENWETRRPVTPEKSQKRRGKIGTQVQQQRGTPGSLYDGDGFLKVGHYESQMFPAV
ncbi:hypothetical protein K490DRAFT_56680 [Saccharata proteae CBS 121410]|uniref:Uncharacterized protein n=1 Tax=Saccharata proteae CBS 121410 TaxID=1314787 RepID=A0A9P4HT91_9PEZI|nr:hypothetical protein K490DRAFT_56680 [Saccharata proteae CBS 121410]